MLQQTRAAQGQHQWAGRSGAVFFPQCVNRFFDVESFNMENAGLGFHFEKVGKCISMFGISCWNLVFLGLPLRLAKVCSMRKRCLITLEELSLCRMQGSRASHKAALGIDPGTSRA